jgi:hypothetical protein
MAYITNTDSSTLPYNDDGMKYELLLRQYVPTASGVKLYTGIDLMENFDTPEQAEALLIECSDDVYQMIYDHSVPRTINFKRYRIAKDETIREEFKRALIYQVRYALRSGGNLLKDQHGINIEKGKGIDINMLRNDVRVGSQVKSVLNRLGLLYSGYIPYVTLDDDEVDY